MGIDTMLSGICFCALLAAPVGAVRGGQFSRNMSSGATVIIVTTTTDDITQNGNCTLREAVLAANGDQAWDACPAGNGVDTIQLPAGVLQLSVPAVAYDDPGATEGDIDITASVNILGQGREHTIIDGTGFNDRLLQVSGQGTQVTLQDLTLQNGSTNFFQAEHLDGPIGGAAVYNTAALTLERVALIHNRIGNYESLGGAIYSVGSLVMRDCLAQDNADDDGGGVVHSQGDLLVERCQFLNNHSYDGGALEVEGTTILKDSLFQGNIGSALGGAIIAGGTVTATHVILKDNQGGDGGGMTIFGALTLTDSQVIGNSAQGNGGGIQLREGASLDVQDTTFQDNHAIIRGGGIYLDEGAQAKIAGSTLTGNQAGEGGGIFMLSGALDVQNVTIFGNYADLDGAGLDIYAGQASLDSVTVAGNVENSDGSIGSGTGIRVKGGAVSLHNTLLAGSQTVNGTGSPDCSAPTGAIHSLGYNLVGDASGCNWASAPGDQVGTLASPLDPDLQALADNGGLTQTAALKDGSPAIDTGDPLHCLAVDQRGISRPQDGNNDGIAICDIGAFEVVSLNTHSDPPPPIYLPLVVR